MREANADVLRERAERRRGSILKKKWTLDALLGLGGMAAVYSATHANRNRVAIKILYRELCVNADVCARFQREAYVANSVGHPGAVRVLDDDVTDDGEPFLVMELLEGESLDAKLERDGPLPAAAVIEHASQLLDVLSAAHAKGIVHRDIKPHNVFLTPAGQIKVLDFGVARLADGSASATLTGTLLGTPAFMSPEQAGGRSSAVGPASDLWAVGATMFTLLTGKFVHEADNAQAHLIKAAITPARSVGGVRPDLAAALVRAVDRALAFEASDRWESAAAMQRALHDARGRLVTNLAALFDDSDEDDEVEEETRAMPKGLLGQVRRSLGRVVKPLSSAPQPPPPPVSPALPAALAPTASPEPPAVPAAPVVPEEPSFSLRTTAELPVVRAPDRRAEEARSPSEPMLAPPDAGHVTTQPWGAPPPRPSAPQLADLTAAPPSIMAFPAAGDPALGPPPALARPPSVTDLLPEAKSLSAQAISHVTPPTPRRSGLGRVELAAVAGSALAAICVVAVLASVWTSTSQGPDPGAANTTGATGGAEIPATPPPPPTAPPVATSSDHPATDPTDAPAAPTATAAATVTASAAAASSPTPKPSGGKSGPRKVNAADSRKRWQPPGL